jgi:hypothetical protein
MTGKRVAHDPRSLEGRYIIFLKYQSTNIHNDSQSFFAKRRLSKSFKLYNKHSNNFLTLVWQAKLEPTGRLLLTQWKATNRPRHLLGLKENKKMSPLSLTLIPTRFLFLPHRRRPNPRSPASHLVATTNASSHTEDQEAQVEGQVTRI